MPYMYCDVCDWYGSPVCECHNHSRCWLEVSACVFRSTGEAATAAAAATVTVKAVQKFSISACGMLCTLYKYVEICGRNLSRASKFAVFRLTNWHRTVRFWTNLYNRFSVFRFVSFYLIGFELNVCFFMHSLQRKSKKIS